MAIDWEDMFDDDADLSEAWLDAAYDAAGKDADYDDMYYDDPE